MTLTGTGSSTLLVYYNTPVNHPKGRRMYLYQVCPPNGGLSFSTNVVLPTAIVHSRNTIVYHVFEVTGRCDLPLSGATKLLAVLVKMVEIQSVGMLLNNLLEELFFATRRKGLIRICSPYDCNKLIICSCCV